MTSFMQSFDQQRREATKLYFAYGSNLNVRQMSHRCPTAKKVKPLPVYGAKLVFRGVADIETTDNPADVVLGGLWRITRRDEEALDRYEGVRSGMYTRETFYIRDKSRHWHPVLYYKMNSKGIFPPSEGYLASIVRGYLDFGLDLTKLDEAVRSSWNDKNKTDDMRQRFLRDRPVLAKTLEIDRRTTLTRRPEKVRRPDPAHQRKLPLPAPNPGIQQAPKFHQPSWPSIGPNSKLLPKPKSEQSKAPPIESLFPQGSPNPQASADEMKRKLAALPPIRKKECCGAFSLGGPLCHDCPATTLDDARAPSNPNQLPHGED